MELALFVPIVVLQRVVADFCTMYFVKTPTILPFLFPNVVHRIPNIYNKIFLTFDDGPTPEITEFTLDTLNKFNAKASFFCVGKNVVEHPTIFKKLMANGHTIANHTFDHLNGLKTNTNVYLNNIFEARKHIPSDLFRPPYGQIKFSQFRSLKKDYKIVMFDILAGDFDQKLQPEKCLHNLLKYAKVGSIIVLHDSVKAAKTLQYVLPRFLKYCQEQNWVCAPLDPDIYNFKKK